MQKIILIDYPENITFKVKKLNNIELKNKKFIEVTSKKELDIRTIKLRAFLSKNKEKWCAPHAASDFIVELIVIYSDNREFWVVGS